MNKIQFLLVILLCSAGNLIFAQNTKSDKAMFDNAYTLQPNEIKEYCMAYKRGIGTSPILYSIERGKKETKVIFLQPIYFDSQWLHYSPGFKIIDRSSGDEYNVRGYDHGLPMGRLLIIKGYDQKYILVTLIFPKLKKKVKRIDILELPHEKDLIPSNDDGMPKSYVNIKVSDYLVSSDKHKEVFN